MDEDYHHYFYHENYVEPRSFINMQQALPLELNQPAQFHQQPASPYTPIWVPNSMMDMDMRENQSQSLSQQPGATADLNFSQTYEGQHNASQTLASASLPPIARSQTPDATLCMEEDVRTTPRGRATTASKRRTPRDVRRLRESESSYPVQHDTVSQLGLAFHRDAINQRDNVPLDQNGRGINSAGLPSPIHLPNPEITSRLGLRDRPSSRNSVQSEIHTHPEDRARVPTMEPNISPEPSPLLPRPSMRRFTRETTRSPLIKYNSPTPLAQQNLPVSSTASAHADLSLPNTIFSVVGTPTYTQYATAAQHGIQEQHPSRFSQAYIQVPPAYSPSNLSPGFPHESYQQHFEPYMPQPLPTGLHGPMPGPQMLRQFGAPQNQQHQYIQNVSGLTTAQQFNYHLGQPSYNSFAMIGYSPYFPGQSDQHFPGSGQSMHHASFASAQHNGQWFHHTQQPMTSQFATARSGFDAALALQELHRQSQQEQKIEVQAAAQAQVTPEPVQTRSDSVPAKPTTMSLEKSVDAELRDAKVLPSQESKPITKRKPTIPKVKKPPVSKAKGPANHAKRDAVDEDEVRSPSLASEDEWKPAPKPKAKKPNPKIDSAVSKPPPNPAKKTKTTPTKPTQASKSSQKVKTPPKGKTRGWTEAEEDAIIVIMVEIISLGKTKSHDARWEEAAKRLKKEYGFERTPFAVKNQWNRELRAKSGMDERSIPNSNNMRTSLLAGSGKKRKRSYETEGESTTDYEESVDAKAGADEEGLSDQT